jgi:hypothetical protein
MSCFAQGGMMKVIKVLIYSPDRKSRQLVEVEVIEEKETTLMVKLPDGNIIKRRKNRDFPQEEKTNEG